MGERFKAGAGRRGRKKLLLLSTTSEVGGTERIVLTLGRHLPALDVGVTTVLADMKQAEDTRAWFQRSGVDASVSKSVLTIYQRHDFDGLRALRALVRRTRPDAVNIHYGGNHISFVDVSAIRAAGVGRCVVSVHHPNPIDSPRQRLMTQLGARLSHAVVVTTQMAADLLADAGVPRAKLRVVAPSVESPAERPERESARRRLGLPADAFVVGTLARLSPAKGVDALIKAAGKLPSKRGLHVLIAGEGPARPELERLGRDLLGERISFTGWLRDTSDVYAACDVFSLPSHMEGFGLVYVEAAHYGVPSIATAVGGIPEAVRDGDTGLLVPVHGVDELASAIERLRSDPHERTRLGRAAKQRAEREFSPPVMAAGYERVLFG